MKVLLTGIMSVKSVRDGAHDMSATWSGRISAAVHHQHFFSFRLDLDVDGAGESGSGDEQRRRARRDAQNPFGGAFTMQETALATRVAGAAAD